MVTLCRLPQRTDGDIAGSRQTTVLDLTLFAGQILRLAFRAHTSQDRPTDFFPDDASAMVCVVQTQVYLPLVKRETANIAPS